VSELEIAFICAECNAQGKAKDSSKTICHSCGSWLFVRRKGKLEPGEGEIEVTVLPDNP
jgi:hypothetical protein